MIYLVRRYDKLCRYDWPWIYFDGQCEEYCESIGGWNSEIFQGDGYGSAPDLVGSVNCPYENMRFGIHEVMVYNKPAVAFLYNWNAGDTRGLIVFRKDKSRYEAAFRLYRTVVCVH